MTMIPDDTLYWCPLRDGVSVYYKLEPGQPATATEPATADEVRIESICVDSYDISDMLDKLDSSGWDIWQRCHDIINARKPWLEDVQA